MLLVASGPAVVHVVRGDRALVRVHGRCRGFVLCAGRLHPCWGPFAHAFSVPARASSVSVVALGFFGLRRVAVAIEPLVALREPHVEPARVPSPQAAHVANVAVSVRVRPLADALPSSSSVARALPVRPQLVMRTPGFALRGHRPTLRLPRADGVRP